MAKKLSRTELALRTALTQIVEVTQSEGKVSITTSLGTFNVEVEPGKEQDFSINAMVEVIYDRPILLNPAEQKVDPDRKVVSVKPLVHRGTSMRTEEGVHTPPLKKPPRGGNRRKSGGSSIDGNTPAAQ